MPGALKQQGLRLRGAVLAAARSGRIDSWERVWLTFDDIRGAADIRLNDRDLGSGVTGRVAYEVTAALGPRNQLEVLLHAENDEAGLAGEVAMEVRALAYLADVVAVRRAARVEISGQVAGQSDEPLDLYGLIERRNVHYQAVQAGGPFSFQIEAEQGQTLRVELVWRSQIWYATEVALPG